MRDLKKFDELHFDRRLFGGIVAGVAFFSVSIISNGKCQWSVNASTDDEEFLIINGWVITRRDLADRYY